MVAGSKGLSDADRRRGHPYHQPVFVLPPWREIYRTDGERDQTYEHAVQVHDRLGPWYARCGYALVEVPRAPVEERCAFVLRRLGETTE